MLEKFSRIAYPDKHATVSVVLARIAFCWNIAYMKVNYGLSV